ncbi:MAG TPA: alanine racemase C-terminal domain-containing protein [Mucilaginibacter sp.]
MGYGRRGIANKTLTIAVLPIGYADGLNRRLQPL